MMRLFVALLSFAALAFAAPAFGDAPTPYTFTDVFPDVNPCTGNVMTVTITGSGFFHEHASREVAYGHRTITTSDGLVGHGTETFVGNGQIVMFRQTDILTNASGQKVRASGVFVVDFSTDTVRVDRFELTCLTP